MEIAIFVAGMAAGIALHRAISKSIYRGPWTICVNCEQRKKTVYEIPCPEKGKKLLPEEDSFKDYS